jgi:hypothetical protein
MEKTWEIINKYYSVRFDIPPRVVDTIACEELLLLCVSGLSNKSIAYHLDMDVDYVEKAVSEFLLFEGWEYDLDINPFYVYNNHKEYQDFCETSLTITPLLDKTQLNKSYNLCQKFEKIRKEINKYYDNNQIT